MSWNNVVPAWLLGTPEEIADHKIENGWLNPDAREYEIKRLKALDTNRRLQNVETQD